MEREMVNVNNEVVETLLEVSGLAKKENNGLDLTQGRSLENMSQMSNSLPQVKVKQERPDVHPEKINLQEFELEEAVRIILKASLKLKCTDQTRCKTLLLYHKFKKCSADTEYEPKLVAAACLSLGMKGNGESKEMNTIVYLFCCILGKEHPRNFFDGKCDHIKESITMMECLILRSLDFRVSFEIAHKYLAYFMYDIRRELSREVPWDRFITNCKKLTFDFYLTNKCLLYDADSIAVTVIHVALYFMGIDVTERDSYLGTWIKALNDTCSEDDRRDIIKNVFRVCYVGPVAEREHQKRNEFEPVIK